ncbi:MAG TPA: FHA domain-containing protein [Vicinamibacterales bacterium]|nr:FHA domain-containing protein [Vicinamibacterales bacterium]
MKVKCGEIELDSESRRLSRAGQNVHISTKAFDLLKLLVEQRPAVVDKATIRRRLWQDTFVSDANLPTLIAEIRSAIGDDAKQPRFVRTVHGIGYSFDAQAEAVTTGPGPAEMPAAWLVGATLRLALGRGGNVVGREGADVIAVQAATVSRRHARLTIDERGTALVEDLGSKNGSFVNDRPVVGPAPIADGDIVRIGSVVFTFRVARPVTSTQTL